MSHEPERRVTEAKIKWSRGYTWNTNRQEYVYTDEEWREYFSIPHNAWLKCRREGGVRQKEKK